ncbi:MAG: polysaccharide deacetylase family protein [Thermomonas sp.]
MGLTSGSRGRRVALAALLSCIAAVASAQQAVSDRRIAITIDDLPWQHIARISDADLQARHAQLIAQLKQANAPVVAFVNEDKLERDGVVQPKRLDLLRDWLDAGVELGNHTYGHVDMHVVGIPAFDQAILDGERQLRPLLAERGMQPRWFRHPYLRAGRSQADKAEVRDFLEKHGYRIAPVTVDNGEWVWAAAYENVLGGTDKTISNVIGDHTTNTPVVDAASREDTLRRLRQGYVPYMLNKVDYYERQSQALLGYALPQVWLMHANALNSACYAELIAAVRRRGYRTITLDEAMRDPAYARADGYEGRYGPSWLHRWAMADKKPKGFYTGEPVVPKWVLDLAGVDSE